MFLVANLIEALAKILDVALSLYTWVIIIRALLSWVNPDPYNVIVQFLYRATEPVLRPVRRWIPLRNFGIDLSPVIVYTGDHVSTIFPGPEPDPACIQAPVLMDGVREDFPERRQATTI